MSEGGLLVRFCRENLEPFELRYTLLTCGDDAVGGFGECFPSQDLPLMPRETALPKGAQRW